MAAKVANSEENAKFTWHHSQKKLNLPRLESLSGEQTKA